MKRLVCWVLLLALALPGGAWAREFAEVTLETGRLTRRLQTGLLRTYVLLLGTGMAVMAIVFLLVR